MMPPGDLQGLPSMPLFHATAPARRAVRAVVAAAALLLAADASTARADTVYRAILKTTSLPGGTIGSMTLTLSTDERRIVIQNGSGLLFGSWLVTPGDVFFPSDADVPADPVLVLYLKSGNLRVSGGGTLSPHHPIMVTANGIFQRVTPPHYMLAEAATGAFFDTDLLITNPNDTPAEALIVFLTDQGASYTQRHTLPATSRMTLRVDDIPGLEATTLSITVTSSTGDLPLVVERTMRWGAGGAHSAGASPGAERSFYFADGLQGDSFSTYLLLANPASAPNVAHITYLREGETPLRREYVLPPLSRFTIDAGREPDLAGRAFATAVAFDQPAGAERVTYFGTDPIWSGGHASAGVVLPSSQWYFAEGATGPYFTTYLVLANPQPAAANVTVTYVPSTGAPITRTHWIGAEQRLSIDVRQEDPALATAAFGIHVVGQSPIFAERSTYWPRADWTEGHSGAGVVAPARSWGLADGRVGGPTAAQTYVVLANFESVPADVTITWIRDDNTTLTKTFTVPAMTRRNVWVGGPGSDVPELADESFSAIIRSTVSIVVERSMYWNVGDRIWGAGVNVSAVRLPFEE
jgi:hypothetical protein